MSRAEGTGVMTNELTDQRKYQFVLLFNFDNFAKTRMDRDCFS